MRAYRLNSNIHLLVNSHTNVDDDFIDAYEVVFCQLLSPLAISNSGVLEIADLNKHKMIGKPQKVYPYLYKKTMPAFCFLILKN